MLTVDTRTVVSFGTFEVDLENGELRRAGLRIKLQGQPFRVLKTLLSRAGEVVSREELQREIWGTNTTIDFERGIAGAINKIREALGDSADSPRYIETLARRGFRFIAPVRTELLPPRTAAVADTGPSPSIPSGNAGALHRPEETSSPDALAAAATGSGKAAIVPPALEIAASRKPGAQKGQLERLSVHPGLLSGVLAALLLAVSLAWILTAWRSQRVAPLRPPHIEQLSQGGTIYSGPPNPEDLLAMVTDGPHIFTSVETGGRLTISSIDLNGTLVQPISLPDDLHSVSIADISRDGSRLLVRSRPYRDAEQPLWIVPASGSTAQRLGEIVAHDATWMPDGDSVLFAFGNELRIIQLAGGTVRTYATLPGRAFWPRWSPDGSTLRFTLLDPITHSSSLWETTAQDPRPRRLDLPELASLSLCCGSWTSDGAVYALQASNSAGSNIWALSERGHHRLTELTNGPLRFLSPLPGRTGDQLYFVGLEQPVGTRLFDRVRRQFLPAPPYLAQARRVTYSRDGKWLAWTDTSGRLWRARSSDGSGRLQLSEEDLEVFLAQWAPDGQHLVIMARKPGETWKLYTVASTGGVPHLLLSDKRNLADPDWSADGRSIVFGREADLMGKEIGSHDIQILDLANQRLQVLPGSEDMFSPRWSPDGRWIAALSQDQNVLKLFDLERHTWKTLYTGGAADPVWSADSTEIYLHAFASPHSAILRVRLDGAVQTVADSSEVGDPTIQNYFFGGITPEGMPFIEPRVGTGDLYAVSLSTLRKK